jgi:hypothetical protein
MKGMNLSGNPGMVQPMQIPPTLGQPPIPLVQRRLHSALHHRPPASQLHDALARAVLAGKFGLLIVSAAIAALMYRLAEKPGRPKGIVQRNHGRASSRLMQQVEQRLGHLVGRAGQPGMHTMAIPAFDFHCQPR